MTPAPDDDARPPVPSFADVTGGSGPGPTSSGRWRRWGLRSRDETGGAPAGDGPVPPRAAVTVPVPPPPEPEPEPEPERGPTASAVRPYAWTRGRTKSGFDLAIETLVSTSLRGREQLRVLPVEHRAVAELCDQARSVAEVAALLSLPLGVARVLLGDMAGLGVVTVHQTASSTGKVPDLALMERVLSGLRRL